VPENVTISHRGGRYEIGRGPGCYGIWQAGTAAQSPPVAWWPQTPEGWRGAWSRFTAMEAPATIAAIGQRPPADTGRSRRAVVAAALLAVGVGCGIGGLFPGYLGGASLASESADLIPHLIYLAAWVVSALLIVSGGARLRAGALLGLFFADLGSAITGTAAGTGLVLSMIGWACCAAGSATALRLRRPGALGRPRGHDAVLTLTLATLAALGAAIAFAPSWDSYTLHAAVGASQTVTEGNAFANPAPVIAGDVAVMVALVAVVAVAALWRPVRYGAALVAGATVPMAAQAISALVLAGQPASPAMFGISPSQAAAAGITVSSGLTAVFWVYCVFVVALVLAGAWMFLTPAAVPAPPAPDLGPAPLDPATVAPSPAAPSPAAPSPVAPGPAAPDPAAPDPAG
jgi:hypothetical protein